MMRGARLRHRPAHHPAFFALLIVAPSAVFSDSPTVTNEDAMLVAMPAIECAFLAFESEKLVEGQRLLDIAMKLMRPVSKDMLEIIDGQAGPKFPSEDFLMGMLFAGIAKELEEEVITDYGARHPEQEMRMILAANEFKARNCRFVDDR